LDGAREARAGAPAIEKMREARRVKTKRRALVLANLTISDTAARARPPSLFFILLALG
jgi:hypothetical protein